MLTLGYGGVKRRRTELKEDIGEEEEIKEEIIEETKEVKDEERNAVCINCVMCDRNVLILGNKLVGVKFQVLSLVCPSCTLLHLCGHDVFR